jgi:hypothetical protein
MRDTQVFDSFAARFVRSEFRVRFVHEATKKPDKLYARICHNIGDLFEQSFADGNCTFEDSEHCVMLAGLKGFRPATWAEANRLMGLGDGILVIGNSGAKFCAETEAMKGSPAIKYAGGS